MDLFKAKDTDMSGMLPVEEIRDLLHQAMLGLSRMQIYTVISEAEVNAEDKIAYTSFVPRAVGLIRSMLSFEKCIVSEANKITPEEEDNFFTTMDEVFEGSDEIVLLEDFMQRLEQSGTLEDKELAAVKILLHDYEGGQVPVEEAKSQTWSLLKSMRRASVS